MTDRLTDEEIAEIRGRHEAHRWRCDCGHTEDGLTVGGNQASRKCPSCGKRRLWSVNPEWGPIGDRHIGQLLDEVERLRGDLSKCAKTLSDIMEQSTDDLNRMVDAAEVLKDENDSILDEVERLRSQAESDHERIGVLISERDTARYEITRLTDQAQRDAGKIEMLTEEYNAADHRAKHLANDLLELRIERDRYRYTLQEIADGLAAYNLEAAVEIANEALEATDE